MEANLILDIGNTAIKAAVFQGEHMVYHQSIAPDSIKALQHLLSIHPIKKIGMSAVADLPNSWVQFLDNLNLPLFELEPHTPLPIAIRYDTPLTLGKDRIAAAVGAYYRFAQRNCLIVDAGTCITADWLSDKGVFMGGNISPGIDMRLKAMHHFTDRLPRVQTGTTGMLMGQSTLTALQNGALQAAVFEIKQLLTELENLHGSMLLVLTGGDGHFFESIRKSDTFASPFLVLEGMHQILNYAEINH